MLRGSKKFLEAKPLSSETECSEEPPGALLCSRAKNESPEGGLGVGRWAGSKRLGQQVTHGGRLDSTQGASETPHEKRVRVSQISQAWWGGIKGSRKNAWSH